jgi:tRNA A37 methylthiotransferase MiaB
MRQLGSAKKKEFCRRFVGRRLAVLIEEKIHKESGCQVGFSRNYLPVLVSGEHRVNREVDVRIDGFDGAFLTGTVVPAMTEHDRWPTQSTAGV